MSEPKPMRTLSEVIEALRKKGITDEIIMNENKKFVIRGTQKSYEPQELKIRKVYRFEGDSNPADNVVLLLIQDYNNNLAMILDSYGAESSYEGPEFDEFLKAIPTEEREEYDY